MLNGKVIGIDVGKATLVVGQNGTDETKTFFNTPNGIGKLLKHISQFHPEKVIVEACHYQKLVHRLLTEKGLKVHVANPFRARAFANAFGAHGKTDAVDARMLAEYGIALPTLPTPIPSIDEESVKALLKRRNELIHNRAKEKNRRHKSPEMEASYVRSLEFIESEIKYIDAQIDKMLEKDTLKAMCRNVEILESIRGVGRTSALNFIVYLPELGTVNRREIASLAGVAPRNNDSGNFSGKRFVGAGRSNVKHALYMCVLAAVQFNAELKHFYQHLKNKGKHNLICRVAVMKKLVVLMNTLIAEQRNWEPRMAE